MFARLLLPSSKPGREGARPGWFNQQVTPVLESLSRRACTHPIHTLAVVALLASTTYIGLLEGKVFGQDGPVRTSSRTDWAGLAQGSKDLCVGEHTGWKWQVDENGRCLQTQPVRLSVGYRRHFTSHQCAGKISMMAESDSSMVVPTSGPVDPRLSGLFGQGASVRAATARAPLPGQFFGQTPAIDLPSAFAHLARLGARLRRFILGGARFSLGPTGASGLATRGSCRAQQGERDALAAHETPLGHEGRTRGQQRRATYFQRVGLGDLVRVSRSAQGPWQCIENGVNPYFSACC